MTQSKKALLWSIANAALTKGITLVFFFVLGRALGPKVFGAVASAWAIVNIAEVLSEMRLPTWLIRAPQDAMNSATAIWAYNIIASVITSVTIWYFAPEIGSLLRSPDISQALQIVVWALPIAAIAYVPEATLRKNLDFKKITTRTAIANIAGGTIALALAQLIDGTQALSSMFVTTAIISAFVTWKTSAWRPNKPIRLQTLARALRESSTYAGTQLWSMTMGHASLFVVTYYAGTTSAGLYNFALRIYDAVMRLTVFAIAEAALPTFSKLNEARNPLYPDFIKLTLVSASPAVYLLTIIALTADPLIPAVFGGSWNEATLLLRIVLVGGIFASFGGVIDMALISTGNTRPLAISQTIQTALFVAQLPFVPRYGPLAPLAAWTLKEAIVLPYKFNQVKEKIPITTEKYIARIAPIICAAIAMAVCYEALILTTFQDTPTGAVMTAATVTPIYWLITKKTRA